MAKAKTAMALSCYPSAIRITVKNIATAPIIVADMRYTHEASKCVYDD
jgi:hypothetical protein